MVTATPPLLKKIDIVTSNIFLAARFFFAARLCKLVLQNKKKIIHVELCWKMEVFFLEKLTDNSEIFQREEERRLGGEKAEKYYCFTISLIHILNLRPFIIKYDNFNFKR